MAEVLRKNGYKVEKINSDNLPTIEEFLESSNLELRTVRVIRSYYVKDMLVNDLNILIDDAKKDKIRKLRGLGDKSWNDLKNELRVNLGVIV